MKQTAAECNKNSIYTSSKKHIFKTLSSQKLARYKVCYFLYLIYLINKVLCSVTYIYHYIDIYLNKCRDKQVIFNYLEWILKRLNALYMYTGCSWKYYGTGNARSLTQRLLKNNQLSLLHRQLHSKMVNKKWSVLIFL